MNWTVEYIKPQNFVKIKTEGIYTPSDQIKMIEDTVSQKFWKPDLNLLVDHRNAEFTGTDIAFIKEASKNFEKYKNRIGGGKIAILMKSLTDYARGRQFELLTGSKVKSKFNVFMDEEKAVNWLTS